MKKYIALDIELLFVQTEDIVTLSPGFEGADDGFADPNDNTNANLFGAD